MKYRNNTDIFYMIKQKREGNDDSLTIFAYTAVLAAIIMPHIPQID